MILGTGTTTCGEVLQNIERIGSRAELIYLTWLQGYISGSNRVLATYSGNTISFSPSADTLISAYKNSCRQDAFKTLEVVGQEIYVQLLKQR